MEKIQISPRNFVCVLAFAILLTGVNVYAFNQSTIYQHHDPTASANVFIIIEKPGITYSIPVGNFITDLGDSLVRNLLASTNTTQWIPNNNGTVWMFLSANSSTPAKAWKCDTKEYGGPWTGAPADSGFGRRKGTLVMWYNSTGSDWAYNVTRKFTCTVASSNVYGIGLCYNSSGTSTGACKWNNLFAWAPLTGTLPLVCNVNDNVTGKWVVTLHH